jgi:hypothetical protein
VNLLNLHELLDDVGPEDAKLFIQKSPEDLLLELFVNPQPLLVVFDEIAVLGDGRVEDFQMRLCEVGYVVLFNVLMKHSGNP